MWSRNALVLMYHGFGVRAPKDDPEHLFISAGAFTAQLELLRKLRYRFLDVDDYLSGLDAGVWPRRSVLMTIDDGYPSVADIAGPVLARFDAPSVLFVPPDRLGRTSSWMPGMPGEAIMTADKLRAVGRFGIEVGAHGWDHSLMLGLTEADLAQHTTGAADVLEP